MSTLFIFVHVYLIVNEIFFTVSQNSCGSHKDCESDDVCCKNVPSAEFRCRKSFDPSNTTQSCFGYYCTSTNDCPGLKDSQKLCCRSNRCTLCPQCSRHFDCGHSRFCCMREWYEQRRCSYSDSCLGEICLTHSDCGLHECCRSKRCVKCSDPGCASHSQCPTEQYCCFKRNQPGNCKWKCLGDDCLSDNDCASSEHCHSNQCGMRTKCISSSDCSDGSYCCRLDWHKVDVCAHSCGGNLCIHDNDCGRPDSCCLNNMCHVCGDSCTNSWHCLNGALCCKGTSLAGNKCASNCKKESCDADSHCVTPDTWCVGGTCSRTKQCNFTSDCITLKGEERYCCMDESLGIKFCRKICMNRKCNSKRDCLSTECCDSAGACTALSECSWTFPLWLIGVLVAVIVVLVAFLFGCYFFKKARRQLDIHQSDQNVTQNTLFSGNERERAQNIYDDPPTSEMPVSPDIPLFVSRPEAREQIYYPLSTVNNNEFLEMVELPTPRLENGINHRDGPGTLPPPYLLHDPSALLDNNVQELATDNRSMPPSRPSPHLFDGRRVTTEYDNVPSTRL